MSTALLAHALPARRPKPVAPLASTFDFTVPPELEARVPAEARGLARDGVRLLVSRDGRIDHATFRALPEFLRPGDLLVANDSRVLPASLHATDEAGAPVTIHLSTQVAGSLWVAEPRVARPDSATTFAAGAARPGSAITFVDTGAAGSDLRASGVDRSLSRPLSAGQRFGLLGGAALTLLAPLAPPSERLWYVEFGVPGDALDYLARHGAPILYAYADASLGVDAYQTIFARVPGSAESPSAGRPFTAAAVAAARRRGIGLATITLHCGVSSPEMHEPPQAERYAVPPSTVARIAATRAARGRIIAIGTTVVRALESSTSEGRLVASNGWTDLLISPERPPRVVDGLLTGLHEPRASHLQLIGAFLGEPALRDAYAQALAERYLWHEFGDVHLILPDSIPQTRTGEELHTRATEPLELKRTSA